MKTYNNVPNFSIITPGGCNANCGFCFANDEYLSIPMTEYIVTLHTALSWLPEQFYQISITGGEPLISPHIDAILYSLIPHKAKFRNILLTTNGTDLLQKIQTVSIVDHINISRHHYDEEKNKAIFNSRAFEIDALYILECVNQYSKKGIDISLNCVINNKTTKEFILNYIDFARSLNINTIRFRKENGKMDKTPAEKEFTEYKYNWIGECPVCSTRLQVIQGMNIYWKSAVIEPADVIRDEIFEYVYFPDGNVYSDWAKRHICLLQEINEPIEVNRVSSDSCGNVNSGGRC